MDNLLHKLCEKSEAELWEMVKVEEWTPQHAEIAFYLTEIMKGVKKIEHLKLVQEAMEKAEEMGDAGMEHMLGREPQMSHYARRGGRMSGGRGSRGRYNYMYNSDEDEEFGYNEYARGGSRGGNSNGGNNYAQNGGNYAQGGSGNYGHHPMHHPYPGYMPEGMEGGHIPPHMYNWMPYFESKITEKVEKEWEKERSKDKEKETGGTNRMPPPSTK